MIETLMHVLGLCPDAHNHPSLMFLLAGGLASSCSAAGYFLRNAIRKVVS